MKEWIIFMIAIGFLLITLSGTVTNGLGIIITGLTLIIGGLFLLYKDKKKETNNGNK